MPSCRSTALGRSFFQGQNKLIKLFTALVIKPRCLGCIILGINLLQRELRLRNVSCPGRRGSVRDAVRSGAVPPSPSGPRPAISTKGHFLASVPRDQEALPPQNRRRKNLPPQEEEPEKRLSLSRDKKLLRKKRKKEKNTTKTCFTPERCCELSAVTARSCML